MGRITLLTTTYFPDTTEGIKRYDTWLCNMKTWEDNIVFDGPIDLHIADDGSGLDIGDIKWSRGKVSMSRQEAQGVGASLNVGFKTIFEKQYQALYVEDDYRLRYEFDLQEWIELLDECENIGMVKLSYPSYETTGVIGERKIMVDGLHIITNYLILDRHHYAFNGYTLLMHKRFFEAYGDFPVNVSAHDNGTIYNEHFCSSDGPEIVQAMFTPWRSVKVPSWGKYKPSDRDYEGYYGLY